MVRRYFKAVDEKQKKKAGDEKSTCDHDKAFCGGHYRGMIYKVIRLLTMAL